jgi:hypothetical protein
MSLAASRINRGGRNPSHGLAAGAAEADLSVDGEMPHGQRPAIGLADGPAALQAAE